MHRLHCTCFGQVILFREQITFIAQVISSLKPKPKSASASHYTPWVLISCGTIWLHEPSPALIFLAHIYPHHWVFSHLPRPRVLWAPHHDSIFHFSLQVKEEKPIKAGTALLPAKGGLCKGKAAWRKCEGKKRGQIIRTQVTREPRTRPSLPEGVPYFVSEQWGQGLIQLTSTVCNQPSCPLSDSGAVLQHCFSINQPLHSVVLYRSRLRV